MHYPSSNFLCHAFLIIHIAWPISTKECLAFPVSIPTYPCIHMPPYSHTPVSTHPIPLYPHTHVSTHPHTPLFEYPYVHIFLLPHTPVSTHPCYHTPTYSGVHLSLLDLSLSTYPYPCIHSLSMCSHLCPHAHSCVSMTPTCIIHV